MTSVLAGYVFAANTITHPWLRSLHQVLARPACPIISVTSHESGSIMVPHGRCMIAQEFLDHEQKPDYLWFTDTDAVFQPDCLERLVGTAEANDLPILGGLAFGVHGDRKSLFPTIWQHDGEAQTIAYDYPRDQVVRCAATGAHCLLIRRDVLDDARWHDGHPNPWFRTTVHDGGLVSEDHWFCAKAREFGFPVHVDTRVKTGHVKPFVLDEQMYLGSRDGSD